MSSPSAQKQGVAVYFTWFIPLCGPLQTFILAFLRFLVTARIEDSGSALDFSCLTVVHYSVVLLLVCLLRWKSEDCSVELRSVLEECEVLSVAVARCSSF